MSDGDVTHSAEDAGCDPMLEAVIADYIRRCEAGVPPNRGQLLDRFPDLAADLSQFFAQRDRINQLAQPIRAPGNLPIVPLTPGRQISYLGNYELLEEIARGGMGVVFKARQMTLGRLVAVKMIAAGQLATEQDVQRFQAEAQAAAGLQHPNIVSIHEVGIHDGWHYFSMDFVDGHDLAKVLRKNPLPAIQAATYVRQMSEAIHFAHQQGTLHRDLKPSNVLIDAQNQIHITDFGLAMRVAGNSDLTRTGQIVGTPSYMPPEQAQSKRSLIGPTSDVYSLGAVLYECLAGRPPFRAESIVETIQQVIHASPPAPRLLNPAVPRDVETICLKCLEKDPHRRYSTAQLVADDLGRFLRGEPILARPISRPARLSRWCRRNPIVAGLTAAMLFLLGGIASLATLGYVREAELHREAERSRRMMEESYGELKNEQQRSSRLQITVGDLEERRRDLGVSLAEGAAKLAQGEEKLLETYLQLAQTAWRTHNIELADYYLNQCPLHLRTSAWHDLKRQYYPECVTFDGHRCVAISNDGKLLGAAKDQSVKLWHLPTGDLLHTLPDHQGGIRKIAFSRGGEQLATTNGESVILWDVTSGQHLQTLAGHMWPITDIEFSPTGNWLASASSSANSSNGEVFLWDLSSFERRSLPGLLHVVFSHDGRYLVTGKERRKTSPELVVWDLASEVGDSPTPSFAVKDAQSGARPAAHPHQPEIAVATGDFSVAFWNLATQRVVERFTGELSVKTLAFCRDGKRLAYAGETGGFWTANRRSRTVIWNLITRQQERVLPWYTSEVASMSFSPNGRQLATADGGVVKVWNVTPLPDPTYTILNDIAEMQVGRYDWPQWGGSRSRVNTPAGSNIPIHWDTGKRLGADWKNEPNWRGPRKPSGSTNIKWAVSLGSQTYGNPVVANGRIFVGTNNRAGYLKQYPADVDLGVLLCFEEQTGNFLWQHSNQKLPTGRVHDWPLQGVCSTPVVDGNRLWYVSNRGEVVCLDTEGFYDEEDDGASEWGYMLRTPAYLHSDQTRLITAFSDAGIRIGVNHQLIHSASGVWQIMRWDSKRERFIPLFELSPSNGILRAFSVDEQGNRTSSRELFAKEDDLFPDLNRGTIGDDLQRTLHQAGIQLTHQQLETLDPGRSWQFVATHLEKPRTLRLNRDERHLTCTGLIVSDDRQQADVVWKFDMMKELGVSQHNMANCSMLTVDGMLFVCTSNGVDESHINIPAPDAPSFIALDRTSGKVIWTDNSPGKNILHAQWASPSYGVFDGQPQVIFPGGDGWVYSFDPKGDGQGRSKLLWKFDGNPKTAKYSVNSRSTRNHIIAFPAIYDGLIYIAMGEDPEHGEGDGHLWCIDPTKRLDGGDVSGELAVDQQGNILPPRRFQAVDVTQGERAIPNPDSAVVWHYSKQDRNGDGKFSFEETFHRSMSIPVIKDDILYVPDFSGLVHCLNAKTGNVYWTYDLLSACWSSALLVDGKVYICDEVGAVTVFRHTADPRIAMRAVQTGDGRTEFVRRSAGWEGELISQFSMVNSIYMTPIVANNVLYIATRDTLFAIQESHP